MPLSIYLECDTKESLAASCTDIRVGLLPQSYRSSVEKWADAAGTAT